MKELNKQTGVTMLRDYQLKLKNDIYSQFRNGKKYVLAQLATGG